MIKKFSKLIFAILFFTASFPVFAKELYLSQNNLEYDETASLSIFDLCTGHTESNTAKKFGEYGFSVITQKNYERPQSQIDHTSAYTIGRGKISVGKKIQDAYLIVIRGTDGNEWFSNFDFAPSASGNSHFAMDFLYSAEDIFLDLQKIISDENAIIIVSGHSRGGAVANLLALLLNESYNRSKIYAYTFASPATVRNLNGIYDKNIFNVLNPADLVPYLPLQAWGFYRAGTDIVLEEKDCAISSKKIKQAVTELAKICPSLESYYNDRHSLEHGGLSDDGITMYELFMILATQFSKLTVSNSGLSESPAVLPKSFPDIKNLNLLLSFTESDFSVLFEYLSSLLKNSGQGFSNLLKEHLMQSY